MKRKIHPGRNPCEVPRRFGTKTLQNASKTYVFLWILMNFDEFRCTLRYVLAKRSPQTEAFQKRFRPRPARARKGRGPSKSRAARFAWPGPSRARAGTRPALRRALVSVRHFAAIFNFRTSPNPCCFSFGFAFLRFYSFCAKSFLQVC